MQGAVPLQWEEQPGRPKSRRREHQCFRASAAEGCPDASGTSAEPVRRAGGLSLQELLANDREIHFLAPPPGLVNSKIQDMTSNTSSSSSSSDFNCKQGVASASTSSASGSSSTSPADDFSSSSSGHSGAKSVTLQDLMNEQDKAQKTLEQLFKVDATKKQSSNKMMGGAQAHYKQAIGISGTSAAVRRSTYLPYKQGLLSIFCMSPYDTRHLPVVSPRVTGPGAPARPRQFR